MKTAVIVVDDILTYVLLQTDGQKKDLWSPLPYQGWKPCLKPSVSHSNLLLLRDDET